MKAKLLRTARGICVLCCMLGVEKAFTQEPVVSNNYNALIRSSRTPESPFQGSSNDGLNTVKRVETTQEINNPVKEVRGAVRDTAGVAMAGVSVAVKDRPNVGTTTDLNGKYILSVPDDAVLVISMVGYESQEIPIAGKEVINVVLKRANNTMNDVVVVGFSRQRKKDVIGSVTVVNPSELKVPSSNLTTAIAGRISGMISYQRSGEPGMDNAEFFIRGATTFGYKKEPLILIDGIEYSTTELARLNVDDIAQFSVLKDATASAVYGARGANGVILITTKEGRRGKAKVSVRMETSISSPTKEVELADPITYMKLHNESYLTRGILATPYLQSKIDYTESGINPIAFPTTDWKSELFKKQTINKRGNFSVSGGGEIANYYIAGSFAQDNGILEVDKRNNFNNNIDLKTYNLRSNVGIKITRSTDATVRLYGSFDDYNGPVAGGVGMYRNVMRTNPVLFPAYYPVDDDHKGVNHILFGNYGVTSGQYLNPYADMVRGYKESNRSLMVAQFELKQDLSFLTPGLSLRAMTNTNRKSYFDISRGYTPFWYYAGTYDKVANTYRLTALNPDSGQDFVSLLGDGEKTVNSMFYLEAAANYNRNFGKHGVSGMIVSIARSESEGGGDELQESLPYRNLGVSGRATYNFDSRYFGEFNFGYNGSERFYKTERFGFFPSVGAAWFVSNEKFMEGLKPILSKLKIRGNYGMTGNDRIGSSSDRFFYLSEVRIGGGSGASFGTDGIYSRPGVAVDRYENYDITWETAVNSTFGVELGLFNNSLEVIAEYFTEKRRNILMDRTLPATLGLQAKPKANVGQAKTRSIDISANYSKNFGKNLFVSFMGNFTYARNRFLNYEEPLYDEWYKSRIGYPVNQQWGYIAERLFVDDQEVRNAPAQIFGNQPVMGGDIKYRDLNGDGVINDLDMAPIGYPTNPEIVYGFGPTAKYKSFDFSFFFQGSARSSFWIDPRATAPFIAYRYDEDEHAGLVLENQLLKAYADNHWSEENRNLYALWPRLSSYPVQTSSGDDIQTNNTQRSTWFMRDGAFLRLKQVEFGYTMPRRLTQKAHLESLRIYTTATNLFTLSGFDLWDIEMGGNGLGYPIQKVINFGIQVGL